MTSLKGSQSNDTYTLEEEKIITLTNNSGGILGGLTTGMPIIVRAAFKPTPSISKPQKTINIKEMKETEIRTKGRYDACIVPRAVPVVESMLAITLADHLLGLCLKTKEANPP